MRQVYILAILILSGYTGGQLLAQDYQWWNEKHNWDGYSAWKDYMILSPSYMGPNALPVPEIRNGKMAEVASLSLEARSQQATGDETYSSRARLFLPLFSSRVAVSIHGVTLEHYRVDTVRRDERRIRNLVPEGTASGDVYLSTLVQVLEESRHWPELLLSINLRTASGNKLEDARFTDTPGYYFDLSAGKDFQFGQDGIIVRPFAMAGLYIWQLIGKGQLQNDAFLYGLGVECRYREWHLNSSWGGYNGYLNNGDRPQVWRLSLGRKLGSKFSLAFTAEEGLRDFPYSTLGLKCQWNLGKLLQDPQS